MANPKFIFRDARDTLTDLLLHPLGTTFPIPDLPVKAENVTVLYNNPARITISSIQPDVLYRVTDDNNTTYDNGVLSDDKTEITFETGLLTKEDYTFNVTAENKNTHLSRQLLHTVTVKIGVDEDLNASSKQPIFDYNSVATIVVEKAQSGANYQVKDLKDQVLSEPKSIGSDSAADAGNIELVTTEPVTEDMTVKVTVVNIKHNTPGTLRQKPVIRVSPDVSLAEALKDEVVDYNASGTIVLKSTQKTVSYQVRFEDIDDDTADKEKLRSTVVAPVQGTGKSIELPVDSLKEDTTVYVVAKKEPTDDAKQAAKKDGTVPVENIKELPGRLQIYVRPDPAKKLSVVEDSVKASEGATIRVSNTQRGILYQLRTDPDNVEVGSPAYHHKNYGIGTARIGIEFAIDTFDKDYVELPTGPLDKTTVFNVLAIKATTRKEALVGVITVEVK